MNLAWRYRFLLLLFLTSFATEFIVRGPERFLKDGFAFNDFISPFVQSRAWLLGHDPYSPQELAGLWPKDAVQFDFVRKDVATGTIAAKDGIPSPYPLTCFVVLAPFSGISWSHICIALLTTNVVCATFFIGALGSLSNLGCRDPRTYVFWGLALGFAPLHTAIAAGNLIVVVCALAVAAIWCANSNRDILAGILLGIGICLKPQIGLVFLAYYTLRQKWRMTLVGTGVTTLVAAVSIVRLRTSGTQWLPMYLVDVREMFGAGGINDFTKANYLRFHLLNLQMPTYSILGSASGANKVAWSVTAVLLLAWITLIGRRNHRTELLDLSAIATIALLPVYHRFVDATVLILPLCWCVTTRTLEFKRVAWLVTLFLIPFLVPGASLLAILVSSGHVPRQLSAGWWWDVVIMPHEVWAVLATALVLLYSMYLSNQLLATRR